MTEPCPARSKISKENIGCSQRLLASDVEPDASDWESKYIQFFVQPLNKPSRLVGVVSLLNVSIKQMNGFGLVVVEGNSADRTGRVGRFLFKFGQNAHRVCCQLIVLLCLIEAFYVIDAEGGRALGSEFREIGERFAEKVITGNDEKIVFGQVSCWNNKVDVADRSALVCIRGGPVVDDVEIRLVVRGSVCPGPR